MNKIAWDYSQENLFLMGRKKEENSLALPSRRSYGNWEKYEEVQEKSKQKGKKGE